MSKTFGTEITATLNYLTTAVFHFQTEQYPQILCRDNRWCAHTPGMRKLLRHHRENRPTQDKITNLLLTLQPSTAYQKKKWKEDCSGKTDIRQAKRFASIYVTSLEYYVRQNRPERLKGLTLASFEYLCYESTAIVHICTLTVLGSTLDVRIWRLETSDSDV